MLDNLVPAVQTKLSHHNSLARKQEQQNPNYTSMPDSEKIGSVIYNFNRRVFPLLQFAEKYKFSKDLIENPRDFPKFANQMHLLQDDKANKTDQAPAKMLFNESSLPSVINKTGI